MKRMTLFFLALLAGLFVLAGCERPAQEAPDDAAPLVDPNSAIIPEDKPDEALEVPVEAYPAPTDEGAPAPDGTVDAEAPAGEEAPADEAAPPAETPAEAEQPATEIIHEVQSGDTLVDISTRYGISVEAIIAANNLVDPDRLEIGQKLVIPSSEDVINAPSDAGDGESGDDAAAGEGTPEQIHIVSAGETLYRIGLLYGFTVDELVAYNNLPNPDQLEVGQEIRIPPGE